MDKLWIKTTAAIVTMIILIKGVKKTINKKSGNLIHTTMDHNRNT